jgi:tRNA dimethylallyltransferase
MNQLFDTQYNLITILGPTASGKTTLAAHLSHRIGGEIISADSRQVYRGMDLGTGKDLADYTVDGNTIPAHLINIADAGYKYNVYEFQKDFVRAYKSIETRSKTPILCGGSGLYIEAVLKGFELISVPENSDLRNNLNAKTHDELVDILTNYRKLHNQTDTCNRKRLLRAIEIEDYICKNEPKESNFPSINSLVFGVRFPRNQERARITERLKDRLNSGMIDEVKSLIDSGVATTDLIYYGLEYKWITLYLIDQVDYSTMFEKLNTAIHQFAKRQMTWYRRMERNGIDINWIDGNIPLVQKLDIITNRIKNVEQNTK